MFAPGDYVIYGHTGICQVVGTTTMNMDGVPKDRLYYVLRPDGATEGTIFTPVENPKVAIRRTMSKKEARELLDEIPGIETLDIANDKLREEKYRECMKTCESRELVRVIKTIQMRKKDRLSRRKKVTATDERYLKMAEDYLYAELSLLLDIPKKSIGSYIVSYLSRNQEPAKG
ncbi:MAG: CarD family transcriptional regulator [Eubacteriales bacterium]|nr:CarD family transcriptional regulator [Eubacteriales bacterium]